MRASYWREKRSLLGHVANNSIRLSRATVVDKFAGAIDPKGSGTYG